MKKTAHIAWVIAALAGAAVGCEPDPTQAPPDHGQNTSTSATGGDAGGMASTTGGAGGAGGMGGAGGSSAMLPPPPTNLAVAATDAGGIHLTWKNPSPPMTFAKVKLVRALNMPPAGPDDATAALVYSGPAEAT